MRTVMFACALFTALMAVPSALRAQAADPQDKPVATGPKVHVSESEDVTGCSNSTGGPLASVGTLAGGLLGSKVSGSGRGTMVGAAVGGEVGDRVNRKVRCDPRAEVEDGARTQEPGEKKKKTGLSRLKGALGL